MDLNAYTTQQAQQFISVLVDIHGMEFLAFSEEPNRTAHLEHIGMETSATVSIHNQEFSRAAASPPPILLELLPAPPTKASLPSPQAPPQQLPLATQITLSAVQAHIGNLHPQCASPPHLLPPLALQSTHLPPLQEPDLQTALRDGPGMESAAQSMVA